MVKAKEHDHILADGSIDLEAWLNHIGAKHQYKDLELIRSACVLSQLTGQQYPTESGESCLQQGLAMAEILADLDLDKETIAAAIVYESVNYAGLKIDDVEEHLGPQVAKLVRGMDRMSAITFMRSETDSTHLPHQIDNIRKMLLAMVDDIRVVLIKFAERLRVMRQASRLTDESKQQLATETIEIYAPLANRLGIGQIKWELEDLAFRYLMPEEYKEIASSLNARRIERDKYVEEIIAILERKLNENKIKDFTIHGRAKHIHSIHRKMKRKNTSLSKIYDTIAVRVLVPTIDDCYSVLGIVHSEWKSIPEEFDDYIAKPKKNGYRSLHTAVLSTDNKTFEAQIRTHDMHSEAELGIAAHWRYKEGVSTKQHTQERKIAWLRDVLAWQKELVEHGDVITPETGEYLEDRIYVFTPNGDVIDLPSGSTPLDFAYHIHSEVGHRCRGAKITGKIVPLTHVLKTGDQVEILTAKYPKPSHDWLNPHLGYITSTRAKAKIHHWFKMQDYEKNLAEGTEIIEKELHKLHLDKFEGNQIAKKLNFKTSNDLLAALGRGDIRMPQILTHVAKLHPEIADAPTNKKAHLTIKKPSRTAFNVGGVGSLLTNLAKCCHPVVGDTIIGYITIGRGVSIHRQDCPNILAASERQKRRLMEVSWSEGSSQLYPVDISIDAYDRSGLLKDITALFTAENINVLALNSVANKNDNTARINVTIEVSDINNLSGILTKLMHLNNVIETRRVT